MPETRLLAWHAMGCVLYEANRKGAIEKAIAKFEQK
jgi:hypothetical protein